MKTRLGKTILVLGLVVAGLISLATWLNPLRPVVRSRNRTIEKLRAADHQELLTACRALMKDVNSFTSDHEIPSWQSGWQVVVDRDSKQYRQRLPTAIRDLAPVSVSIATNQVYLFYWNSPVRLSVRAFAHDSEQFGTERLCDGLWLVTQAND